MSRENELEDGEIEEGEIVDEVNPFQVLDHGLAHASSTSHQTGLDYRGTLSPRLERSKASEERWQPSWSSEGPIGRDDSYSSDRLQQSNEDGESRRVNGCRTVPDGTGIGHARKRKRQLSPVTRHREWQSPSMNRSRRRISRSRSRERAPTRRGISRSRERAPTRRGISRSRSREQAPVRRGKDWEGIRGTPRSRSGNLVNRAATIHLNNHHKVSKPAPDVMADIEHYLGKVKAAGKSLSVRDALKSLDTFCDDLQKVQRYVLILYGLFKEQNQENEEAWPELADVAGNEAQKDAPLIFTPQQQQVLITSIQQNKVLSACACVPWGKAANTESSVNVTQSVPVSSHVEVRSVHNAEDLASYQDQQISPRTQKNSPTPLKVAVLQDQEREVGEKERPLGCDSLVGEQRPAESNVNRLLGAALPLVPPGLDLSPHRDNIQGISTPPASRARAAKAEYNDLSDDEVRGLYGPAPPGAEITSSNDTESPDGIRAVQPNHDGLPQTGELALANGNRDCQVRKAPVPSSKAQGSAANVRMESKLPALLRGGRLCLVLDLDHTLVNSSKFSECDHAVLSMLDRVMASEASLPSNQRNLFKLDQIQMYTKLRPGAREFLRKAAPHWELWIHTNGTRTYANAIREVLDPTCELFGDRIITNSQAAAADAGLAVELSKTFVKGLEGRERISVIVDDSTSVWSQHPENLLEVERYVYFPSSAKQLGMRSKTYLESRRDEHEKKGMLMLTLRTLETVHSSVFAALQKSTDPESWDVRRWLHKARQQVLKGVHILFTRVIPLHQEPCDHKLWRMAERFGATCTTETNPFVTHVVAGTSGTAKALWAHNHGKHVVSPQWLECSCTLWEHVPEERFQPKPDPGLSLL
eukprot:jgi/Botrbrau1/15123/Bobra.0283s0002.1